MLVVVRKPKLFPERCFPEVFFHSASNGKVRMTFQKIFKIANCSVWGGPMHIQVVLEVLKLEQRAMIFFYIYLPVLEFVYGTRKL